MILLDTDDISVLEFPGAASHERLQNRLGESLDQEIAVTVISVEEYMRGWLALIKRYKSAHRQIPAYNRLASMFDFFGQWQIMRFDENTADEYERLRKLHPRIGSQDIKIASIALTKGALLLSANLRDFQKIGGLQVEDWTKKRQAEY